ncbi:MAG: hypothetical protein MMC33_009388 [Icmadophila ericetorum]|nr:hypothetical protein [Icmadophila ericetorum]
MRFNFLNFAFALSVIHTGIAVPIETRHAIYMRSGDSSSPIAPKVFIIDMYGPEGDAWHNIPEFDVLAQNITVPGLSPIFPRVHCTAVGDICQLVTGEAGMCDLQYSLTTSKVWHILSFVPYSEINAANTIAAIVHSPKFDLTNTYFLIAGIAGVAPTVATIGSVTFARYAVSVALQYEIDAREIPENFTTGYFPQGTSFPYTYPPELYGTEVFEVSDSLRSLAIGFAKTATLADSKAAQAYRANYASTPAYKPGSEPPAIVACDTATSDVYFTGALLSETFDKYTRLFTNGTGIYCTTEQEDTATLESLLRAAVTGLVDFSRIIVMRTASDFDRPYAGQSILDNLEYGFQGFEPSIHNIYRAGVKVVEGIVNGWKTTFENGVKPSNYIGDIWGTLGGQPDFGPGSIFGGNGEKVVGKRSLKDWRRERAGALKARSEVEVEVEKREEAKEEGEGLAALPLVINS